MPQKPRHTKDDRNEPKPVCVPAGAPEWVTQELIEHTIRVWQPYYHQPLTVEDALEVVLSASRLMNELLKKKS